MQKMSYIRSSGNALGIIVTVWVPTYGKSGETYVYQTINLQLYFTFIAILQTRDQIGLGLCKMLLYGEHSIISANY